MQHSRVVRQVKQVAVGAGNSRVTVTRAHCLDGSSRYGRPPDNGNEFFFSSGPFPNCRNTRLVSSEVSPDLAGSQAGAWGGQGGSCRGGLLGSHPAIIVGQRLPRWPKTGSIFAVVHQHFWALPCCTAQQETEERSMKRKDASDSRNG